MKPQTIGSADFLMKMDLAALLCRSYNLSLIYVPLLSGPATIPGRSGNFRNYRLGRQQEDLHRIVFEPRENTFDTLDAMFAHLAASEVPFSIVTGKETIKAAGADWSDPEHYFNGSGDRMAHLLRVSRKPGRKAPALILLDPSIGLTEDVEKLPQARRKLFLTREEVGEVGLSYPGAVMMVSQSLGNMQVSLEEHARQMAQAVGQPVLAIGDEVLQNAVFIYGGHTPELFLDLERRMMDHLAAYRTIKKSRSILWGTADKEGTEIIPIGSN